MSTPAPKAVPTMSLLGFVSDPATMVDRLFTYYLESEYSQTNIFRGEVTSLTKQIQLNGSAPRDLQQSVRQELTEYFMSHFDAAQVDVRVDIPNDDDPHRINLTLDIIVTKAGVNYSAGRLIESRNAVITSIIKRNNEGSV